MGVDFEHYSLDNDNKMVRKKKGYNSSRNTIIVRKGKGDGEIRKIVRSFGRSRLLERSTIKLPKLHNRVKRIYRPGDENHKETDHLKPETGDNL